jgi:hypothetical protein
MVLLREIFSVSEGGKVRVWGSRRISGVFEFDK